uniref:DNA/RNA non-specific endonuclease domain-containing protein n=1 Tax=Anopheles funestus TaxID=62324 RepID=A0A182RXG3_ANOFN
MLKSVSKPTICADPFKMWSLVVLSFCVIHTVRGQCTINVKTDLTFPEPVFLKNGNLWIPTNGQLSWSIGESNFVACPKNNVVNTLLDKALITCVAGSTFLLNGFPVNISSIVCSKAVTGDHQSTNEGCGNGGTIRNIGFDVSGIGFVNHFTVCYNGQTASAIYTKHTINGDSISSSIVESYRPSFKVAGVPSSVLVDTSYTIKSQQTRLAQLLGSATQAAKYVNSASYLARGHMTPDADGIFRTWQWDTYFYVNVAPQWQKVNGGNWLTIEKTARTIADRLQTDVTVYTGTFDILTLPHANGTQVPITLNVNGITVPKWTWKVIKSPGTKAAIAFITSNDPYRTTIEPSELLCADICRDYGWYNDSFDTFAKGFTYCCNVRNLIANVDSVPIEALAENVLSF